MKIDYVFAFIVLSLLVSVGYLFFVTKNAKYKRPSIKYFPLFVVLTLILSVLGVNFYYSKKMKEEQIQFQILLNKQINDNIVLNEQRKKTLDSLNIYRQQLETAIRSFRKKEYLS